MRKSKSKGVKNIYLILIAISLSLLFLTSTSIAFGGESPLLTKKNIPGKSIRLQRHESATYEEIDTEEESETFYDPLESFNRAMFRFNDRLYFSVLKPVAQGYNRIVPESARVSIRRFFSNITTPIRLSNSLLQLKFKAAGIELSRFVINSTIGVLGFMDPARDRWKLFIHKEDLGQTIGFYKVGAGFYINWPVLGPSSLRDTFGLIGDTLLDPTSYLFPNEQWGVVALYGYRMINRTSLEIGSYEALKKEAIDPYIFIRDAYYQHRESMIKE